MQSETHKRAMEIVKMLIDSGLSIDDQLKCLQDVRKKVEFCKIKGREINQLKIKI